VTLVPGSARSLCRSQFFSTIAVVITRIPAILNDQFLITYILLTSFVLLVHTRLNRTGHQTEKTPITALIGIQLESIL
jgi:hypothetical protein